MEEEKIYITGCTQGNLERGNQVNGVQPRCYYDLWFVLGKKKLSVFLGIPLNTDISILEKKEKIQKSVCDS